MNLEFRSYYYVIPIDILRKSTNYKVFYLRTINGSGMSSVVSTGDVLRNTNGSVYLNYSVSIPYKYINKFVSYGCLIYVNIFVDAKVGNTVYGGRLRGFLKVLGNNGANIEVYSSSGNSKLIPVYKYSENEVNLQLTLSGRFEYSNEEDLVSQILNRLQTRYFTEDSVIETSNSSYPLSSNPYWDGQLTSIFSYPDGGAMYGLNDLLLMVDYTWHLFANGLSQYYSVLEDSRYLAIGSSMPMTSPGFDLVGNYKYDDLVNYPYYIVRYVYSQQNKVNAVLVNLSSSLNKSENVVCVHDPEEIGIIDNKIEEETDLVEKLHLTSDQDLYKIAKYLLSLGLPSVYIYPVPSSRIDEYTKYLLSPMEDGDVGPLLKEDLTFLVFLYPFGEGVVDDLIYFIDNHLHVASNKKPDFESEEPIKRVGQLERYVFIGVAPDVEKVRYIRMNFGMTQGRRTAIVTANYTDPYVLFFRSSDSSVPDGKLYVKIGEEVYDATWQLIALQTLLTYLSLGNYTMPLTNKYVPGISFRGKRLGMNKLSELFNEGSMLLVADRSGDASALCYRSILSSYGFWKKDGVLMSYPEDMEISILFVEDLMDKENRNYLRQFRGEKLTSKMLQFIQDQFTNVVLSGYVNRGWIESFRNVKLWQDPNDPTIIRGYYEYKPVYPINKIWIEHFFIV